MALSGLAGRFTTKPCPLPAGTLASPLDAAAERLSVAVTERAYDGSVGCHGITRAIARYFLDPRAELLVKKALNVAVETRLRMLALLADPPHLNGFDPIEIPSTVHPLDRIAHEALSNEADMGPAPGIPLSSKLAHLAAMGIQAARLTWELFRPLISARCRVEKSWYWVGAPLVAEYSFWPMVFRRLDEAGVPATNRIIFVWENSTPFRTPDGCPTIDAASAPVEFPTWLTSTFLPGLLLISRTVWSVSCHPFDPAAVEAARYCLFEIRHSLPIQRLTHSLRLNVYLDVYEYSATHIAKAMILKAAGTRLVRWPRSVIETAGVLTSFLGYDLFFSGGNVERVANGRSWWPGMQVVETGLLQKDRSVANSQFVSPDLEAAIEAQRSRGRNLFVYFSPSMIEGCGRVIRDGLEAVVETIASHQDWALIVKSKGPKPYPLLLEILEELEPARRLSETGRLVMVRYEKSFTHSCPSGWLIERMTAALGWGSVLAESLPQGKLMFGYYPVPQRVPYCNLLRESGILHAHPKSLRVALSDYFLGRFTPAIPQAQLREAVDAFGDDRTLDRVIPHLWAAPPSATAHGRPVSEERANEVGDA